MEPLYPGAPITCKSSWSSIYKFVSTNRLTDSCTQQLLDLIREHCPSPNSCPRTLYQLKKHLFDESSVSITQHCTVCLVQLNASEKMCQRSACKSAGGQICYFAILPFEQRLREIFTGMFAVSLVCFAYYCDLECYKSAENWDTIQYPFSRPSFNGIIQDIQDGNRYQKLSRPGKFLSVPEHTGLLLCADGVPLFKSSGMYNDNSTN